jgi:hypothetical protein
MTYKGHVENGAVVLDEPGALPDGALVTVEIAEAAPSNQADSSASLADRYRCFIGAIDGLPEDWSENHDTYLRAQHGS